MKLKQIALILTMCLLFIGCSETETKDKKQDLFIGDDVKIQTTAKSAVVANDRESLDMFIKVAMSKDDDRFNALIFANKIFSVENGTKARITDYNNAAFEVKVLEGKFEGRYVWVATSWVKPLKSK